MMGTKETMAKKNDSKSPMDAALDYLSVKARTVREVELRLDELDFGEYEVYAAVERLKELNYLNDEKYAADFVDSRLRTKPMSRRKLREQLLFHFLPKDAVDAALSCVDNATELKNALCVAEKYQKQFSGLERGEAKRRVVSRLAARGFGYDSIKPCVERLYGDAEGAEEAFMAAEDASDDED